MNDKKNKSIDTKEFEIPETLFSRDIENKVFQGIILQTLAGIEGISLVGGNFIDNIFGRSGPENIKGILAAQDSKSSAVNIKIEVNIGYGHSIPAKAEEIQTKVRKEITQLTGLHVASIHTVFKNVVPKEQISKAQPAAIANNSSLSPEQHEEYSAQF